MSESSVSSVHSPEFPCDADLEPYVKAGEIDAWQAMATTTCRAAAKAVAELQELQKKMEQLQHETASAQPSKWTPAPKYM